MFFHNSKKSQATIFVVIGIIILAVFGFIAYQQSEAAKNRISPSISSSGSVLPKTSSVYNYVSLCLETASSDGLLLLGTQGGYIFDVQGSSVLQPNPIKKILRFNNTYPGSVSDVSYLLLRSDDIDSSNLSSNPYPCMSCGTQLGAEPLFCMFTLDFSCRYGRSALIDLDYSEFSMRNQLESFIKNKTIECMDFGLVEEKLGYKITKGNISVNVTFGKSDVSVSAKIPVVVETSAGVPKTEFLDFRTTMNVRMKTIYDFLSAPPYEFLYRDIHILNYSASHDGNDAAQKMSSPLDIRIYHNANGHDSVVMLIDNASVLAGNPYVFQYARENRAPVLSLIHTPNIFSDVDLFAFVNESFEIYPIAADSDEDELTYSFSGWRSFDLMQSELYKSTKQNARIIISREDLGVHNITIKVSDGERSDWQTVRVLVGEFKEVSDVCENGVYGKKIMQVFPEHPPDIEVGFTPVENWNGCSAENVLSDGANVFTCDGNAKLSIPVDRCCQATASGVAAYSSDPCLDVILGGGSENCIKSNGRSCGPDNCELEDEGTFCDLDKVCNESGQCITP